MKEVPLLLCLKCYRFNWQKIYDKYDFPVLIQWEQLVIHYINNMYIA